MFASLLGVNSDCKGEVEGFSSEELKEDPCTDFFKCLCLGCSRLVTLWSVRNMN